MIKFILASGSPRRAEMAARLTDEYEIVVPDIEEIMQENENPSDMVLRLAREKAEAVLLKTNGNIPVLAADTIVVHDRVLGKPVNEEDARNMLTELSDDSHSVITGVAIIDPVTSKSVFFAETTEVHFGKMSSDEIEEYISSGEPMDKAGAYGIQGMGGRYITHIRGCFYNVMGFPFNRIYRELRELDII